MIEVPDFLSKEIIISWLMTHGVKIVLILGVAFFVDKILRRYVNKLLHKVIQYEEQGDKRREDTVVKIINCGITIALWGVVAIAVIGGLEVNVTGVLAGAGIVGLALGFSAQYMIRDSFAGIFVIIENQYRVGDFVCLDNVCGLVEDITLRKTVLRDLGGKEHHIPHGTVKIVSNLSKELARVNLNISITYDPNLKKAIEILNKIGNELAQDSDFKDKIIKTPRALGVDNFSDIGVEIKIVGDTKPLQQW